MKKIKIVLLGGSMEDKSSTLSILNYSANKLNELGAETYIADIKKLDLPIFSYKALKNLKNSKFSKLIKEMSAADGYMFACPEYHGTVSSAFKNVIDVLEVLAANKPPYLSLKPVGCIAIGGAEFAGHSTLNAMISIVHNLRGVAAPNSLAIGYGSTIFSKKGKLTSDVIANRLTRLAGELYTLAVRLKD
jgi:FMN reductase